jgi:hypothetical protein
MSQVRITFERDGYAPTLRVIETGLDDIELHANENRLMPKAAAGTFMGVPAEGAKGSIEFAVAGEMPTTVTAHGLDDSTLKARYLDMAGNVSLTAEGGAHGGFTNLVPGLYAITFGSPGMACFATTGLYGYPELTASDAETGKATVIVPVLEGYTTSSVGVSCFPN